MTHELGAEGLHSDHLAMPKSPPGDEAAFSDEEDEVAGGQCRVSVRAGVKVGVIVGFSVSVSVRVSKPQRRDAITKSRSCDAPLTLNRPTQLPPPPPSTDPRAMTLSVSSPFHSVVYGRRLAHLKRLLSEFHFTFIRAYVMRISCPHIASENLR